MSFVRSVTTSPQRFATLGDITELDPEAPAPIGWRVTLLCALVAFLETISVGMVGGALTNLQETFKISDTVAGLIPTAAILGGLAVALPSARLADMFCRTSVLGAVAVLWTLVALGSAWASVFVLFLAFRVLLGAAAQLNNPAASSMIADAHPARGRAKAYGYERMANYLGLPVGIALGGGLAESLGWRTAFVVMAIPGIVAAIVAFTTSDPLRGLGDLLDRTRHDQDGVAQADRNEALGVATNVSGDEASVRPPTIQQVRTVWKIASLRSVLIGLPTLFLGLGALFFWSTKYFQEVHGLSEKSAGGIAGGVGGTGIVIGIIAGSRFGDRHHGTRNGWRLDFASMGMVFGAASFALMLSVPSVAAQAAFFGMANIGIAIAIPNLTAAVADVVPADQRSSAFSALQFFLAAGSAVGPPLVGAASDIFGTLRPAMAVLLVPLVASAFVVRSGRDAFDADVNTALRLVRA